MVRAIRDVVRNRLTLLPDRATAELEVAAVLYLLAPLVPGLINRVKAWVAGRRGPPVFQLYYDLARLWGKGVVLSTVVSPLHWVATAVSWVALVVAALLLPALARHGVTQLVLVPPLVLIFLVLGTIFVGIATPTEGGALGALGALALTASRAIWPRSATSS